MKELIQTEELRKQLDSVNPLKENFTTIEWILSRRDQMKVAWHEVPGNKRKADPSRRDG